MISLIFAAEKGESCVTHELSRNRYPQSGKSDPQKLSRFEVEIQFLFISNVKIKF